MADERAFCPTCRAPMIKGCNGQGYIMALVPEMEDEGLNPECVRQCPNLLGRQMAQHLGLLAKIQHVESSPLYAGKLGQPPTVDLTGTNLFIKGCRWHNFQPHLKLAVGRKGLTFTFRVITDERLKSIYVGNEHAKARKEQQAGKEINNGLRDAIGDQDLVVIQLGYLGYKNVAAAGVLKEALLIRASANLPTWVVKDPERPWVHSKNADIVEYVNSNFDVITIESDADPGVEPLHSGILVEGEDDDEEDDSDLIAAAQETAADYTDDFEDDGAELDPELAGEKPKWRKRQ